jgi:hypothetical protein
MLNGLLSGLSLKFLLKNKMLLFALFYGIALPIWLFYMIVFSEYALW